MTTSIFIVGLFFTAALIFAGLKAISILIKREKEIDKYAAPANVQSATDSEEYITIKRQLLYELVARNQKLNIELERAMVNYRRSENEINFILNADIGNTEEYDNVRTRQFDYENIVSN